MRNFKILKEKFVYKENQVFHLKKGLNRYQSGYKISYYAVLFTKESRLQYDHPEYYDKEVHLNI